MNRPFEPFYDDSGLQISVYNTKTLFIQLNGKSNELDTGFIKLPLHSKATDDRFRFSVVQNLSAGTGRNTLGLWIHVLNVCNYYLIANCAMSRIEKFAQIKLDTTAFKDSTIGVCQLPSDETVHGFTIYFPNMWFEVNNDSKQETTVQRKEFSLGESFSASYQDMIKTMNHDVYFVVDGKTIGSYKFALCASSDVFRATFNRHTKESKTGRILIDDFDYDIVKIFVESLHTHKICFDDNLMKTVEIKMLANKYNVAPIEKAALDAFNVLNVDQNNFVSLFKIAVLDDGLKEKLVQRFVDALNTEEIVDFDCLEQKMQIQLLQSAMKLVGKKRKCDEPNGQSHSSKVTKLEH